MLPSAPVQSRATNSRDALAHPLPRGTGYSIPPINALTPKLRKPPSRKAFGQSMLDALRIPEFDDGFPKLPSTPSVPGNPLRQNMSGAIEHSQQFGIADKMLGGTERFGHFAGGQTAFVNGDLPRMPQSMPPLRTPFGPAMEAKRDAVAAKLATDPAAIASRQRSKQTYAPVADQDLVLQGALPAVARRTDLTAEQQNAFAERRNQRQAEIDLRKQRQFSRAQFREAATGRGAIYQDDGGLDLTGTMALRMAARNAPTEISVDPRNSAKATKWAAGEHALNALGHQADVEAAAQQAEIEQANKLRDVLIDAANRQREQLNDDRQFNEAARQFDEKMTVEELLALATVDDTRKKNRLAKRKMTLDDVLSERELSLEEAKAAELFRQGEFDRSIEPHRRTLDAKKTMPHSMHKSPYFP